MANINRNKVLMYRNVIALVNAHYEEGITTYAGVWRNHVYPVYPMSYKTFLRIVNLPGRQLYVTLPPSRSARMSERQLSLF